MTLSNMETTKYHTDCMDLVRQSLACQEQQALNQLNKNDLIIDCSGVIQLYKECKKAEREKIISDRRKRNNM